MSDINLQKIKARIWNSIVRNMRNKNSYFMIYPAYWHQKICKYSGDDTSAQNYFAAIPNRGAGIGHQMANWIAGYWYAGRFGLNFAHIPFSSERWEKLLGFGDNEVTVDELIKQHRYKSVSLPLFDENRPEEIALIKKIIRSYSNRKVVFIAEQDQFYRAQFGVINKLKEKFYNTESRQLNQLVYDANYFNIAIHIRRGDIAIEGKSKNPNFQKRWQDNNYFELVLTNVIRNLNTKRPVMIYLFSQGKPEDFAQFKKFENLHFCLDMDPQDSFVHMVYADLLITSKSSFSYKPALLNNGIKVCPRNFWHDYPETDDWILADEDGNFDYSKLKVV